MAYRESFRAHTQRRSIAVPALSLGAFVLLCGLGAGSAGAVTNGSVGIVGTTLTSTAQNAKANKLTVTTDGTNIVVQDTGVAALDDSDGAGGCSVTAATATCPAAAISDLAIDTEDGADTVEIAPAVTATARVITGPGRDAIEGGSGDDILDSGQGADAIVGGDGIDTVDYSARIQSVQVSFDGLDNDGQPGEDDNVSEDVENAIGGAKDDVLTGNEDDVDNILAGGPGADQLSGGGGNDVVSYAGRSAAVIVDTDGAPDDGEAGEGDTVGTDVEGVIGGDGDDTLTTAAGDGLLDGGAGNDTLDGGSGADEFHGGPGTDLLSYASRTAPVRAIPDGEANDGEFAPGGDTVEDDDVADDIERITGGSGDDLLGSGPGSGVIDGGPGSDTASYAQRTEPVSLSLNASNDDGEPGEGDTLIGIENLAGGYNDDTLSGDGASNTLSGGDGDDTLDGGGGADQINGDEGSDTADYAGRSTPVKIDPDGNPDDGSPGENDNVAVDVEGARGGSGDDWMTGNEDDGTFDGGAGNDTFAADPGDDLVNGGPGIDTADYSARVDGVVITLDNVPDDGDAVEFDNIGSDVEIAIGGADDDTLGGNDSSNSLIGGTGDDTLDGKGGDDTLNAGQGDDDLDGGSGADLLQAGAGDDSLSGEEGPDRLLGELGADSLDGGDGDDTLDGGDGDDKLDGGAGADLLQDGAGDDSLSGGEGPDLLLGELGADSLDGGDGDDTLDGGDGDDDLDGGAGADLLQAGAGDDSLSGEEGPDRLLGGLGTDSFDGGDGNDAVASRDGTREDVACGDGSDAADADRFDNVDDDCEALSGFIAGPAVSISSRALKMDRSGVVTVHLVCIRDPKDCEGRLTITAVKSKRLGKKALGRGEFSVSSGDSDDVEITLSKAARRAVLAGKRLRVRIRTAVPRTPDVTRTTAIVAPKKTKKAKKR